MKPLNFKIDRWQPRREKRWERDHHGSRIAHLFTQQGIVEVYSFPGDQTQKAFTSFQLWVYPNIYQTTLKRCYHDRWLRRLARDFAHQCYLWSKQQGI
jgi:hypothetical protein